MAEAAFPAAGIGLCARLFHTPGKASGMRSAQAGKEMENQRESTGKGRPGVYAGGPVRFLRFRLAQ
jgi:hypothetical protein